MTTAQSPPQSIMVAFKPLSSVSSLDSSKTPENYDATSSSSTTSATPLSKIFDVSIVDTYLLQTYIVPAIIDIVQQFMVALTCSSPSRQPHHHNPNNVTNSHNHSDDNIHDYYKYIQKFRDVLIPHIVQCMVPFWTVLVTRGMTPGMRQMNLQFTTTNANPEIRQTWGLRNKLLFYGFVHYIIPELLYPLLKKYIQTMIEYRNQIQNATITVSNRHDDVRDRHRNTNQPPPPCDPVRSVSIARQQQILQRIQSILDGFDTRVLPMVQFVALLLCWSGTTTTNCIAMLLAGLHYTTRSNTTPPLQSSSSSSFETASSLSPAVLYMAMAHRRWLTHHIWETIRTIILPCITAIRHISRDLSNRQFRHRFLLGQQLQRMLAHVRTRVRGAIILTIRSQRPYIQSKMEKHPITTSSHHMTSNDNISPNIITICPFCQQVPRTIALRACCPNCCHEQMYCYSCFYQQFCLDRNPHHYPLVEKDDLEVEPIRTSATVTTTTRTAPYVTGEIGYQILIRTRAQRSSASLPQCQQCRSIIDTVSFVQL